MRADARDNRARILDAADEVFGTGGAAASTDEVARRAGVGIGTVFRHFPTKQDLLRAVLTARLEGLRDRARDLSGSAEPGRAFLDFFGEVVDGAAEKLTIAEALLDTGDDAAGAPARAGQELRQAFGGLLERAQAAGAVRDDVALPEVYALMVGVSRATANVPLDDAVKQRMVALALDGLRPR
jgi:AcrR family transcriptional regulator